MKKQKLFFLLLIALLALEPVAARVFYYADEVDRRNNLNYAFAHPFDGIDVDNVGDFDDYSCISLNDYNRFARADKYDSYDPLTARNIDRDDLRRLRREDQLRIINEDPNDRWDRNDIDDSYNDWNCYTLRDYNSRARENRYDRWEYIDFTDFDHIYEVQKIGRHRYNNFFQPGDFDNFNLQYTTHRAPYYEPYDTRRSPYPLYGYGVIRREDY